MQNCLRYILLLLPFLLFSCQERFTTAPAARLVFSVDTLRFDTVFTGMGSVTMTVKLYNPYKESLNISSVTMKDGRYFRINLDGETDPAYLRDIRLSGKDSLFLFVKTQIDTQDENTPVFLRDEVLFAVNDHTQSLCLEAYGQDVEILRQHWILSDTALLGEKPYLVYDYLAVDTLTTLTIAPGAVFYMHDNAQLVVFGNLMVNGTIEQPVVFRNDRLDDMFTDVPYYNVPARWDGIYLVPPAETAPPHYEINCLEVVGATNAVYVDNRQPQSRPTLSLLNARLHNMGRYGLVLINTDAVVANTEISNCAGYCVYLQGGEHHFVHNTIASFFRNTNIPLTGIAREDVAAVYINNLSKQNALTHVFFYNNVITGIRRSNFLLATPLPQFYTGEFIGNYLRCDSTDFGISRDNVYAADNDTVFVNTYYGLNDKRYFDFRLDSLSPARNVAVEEWSKLYLLDRLGHFRMEDNAPDAGCYEYVPVPAESAP